MRFVKLRGEKKTSELVSRLFQIKGPGTVKRRLEAEAALLKANPFLKDLRKLPPGVVIQVPASPEEPNECEETEADVSISREIAAEIKRGLKLLGSHLQNARSRSQAEAAKTSQVLKSRKLTVAANRDSKLKAVTEKAAQRSALRAGANQVLKNFETDTLTQIEKDLNTLMNRFFSEKKDSRKPAPKPRS